MSAVDPQALAEECKRLAEQFYWSTGDGSAAHGRNFKVCQAKLYAAIERLAALAKPAAPAQPLIIGSTVVSKPGAALEVTQLHLSERGVQAITCAADVSMATSQDRAAHRADPEDEIP